MAIITTKNYIKEGDAVTPEFLNDMVDTCVNANETANKLVQQPDTTNANAVGTPNVSIGADGRLVFSNLKGETGPQGPQGPQGIQGRVGATLTYNASTKTLTIT